MPQAFLTDSQVDGALARLGQYRVLSAQKAAALDNDGVGGHHFLALGLREVGTGHWNIEGGAKLEGGRWVAEDDPRMMDVGWCQISRRWNENALRAMPGVRVRTWKPVVDGKSAYDSGFVPRFNDARDFLVKELRASRAFGLRAGVAIDDLPRFVLAAHNAGMGGALRGYREGDVDRFTANSDYSAWIVHTSKQVYRWLRAHPGWRYEP